MINEVQEKLVVESTLQSIGEVLEEGKRSYPKEPRWSVLETEYRKLQEELSTADWGRLGTLAGLLWYRLDAVLSSLRNIELNTAKMASAKH